MSRKWTTTKGYNFKSYCVCLKFDMTLLEEIQKQIRKLPREKQKKVLDFAKDLEKQAQSKPPAKNGSLRQHPAFGSWKGRKIDALDYQNTLRAEWDDP